MNGALLTIETLKSLRERFPKPGILVLLPEEIDNLAKWLDEVKAIRAAAQAVVDTIESEPTCPTWTCARPDLLQNLRKALGEQDS